MEENSKNFKGKNGWGILTSIAEKKGEKITSYSLVAKHKSLLYIHVAKTYWRDAKTKDIHYLKYKKEDKKLFIGKIAITFK